ncbi:unnamed protein product [Paramecium octaurelia]|uniref:Uncharacterized protein n=1 Tax=Paramecium octaurelia TaxID=43137 RepID=A0A8S1VX29_PAROT|nr:unnamed protein product [Paramecium octaurelia]
MEQILVFTQQKNLGRLEQIYQSLKVTHHVLNYKTLLGIQRQENFLLGQSSRITCLQVNSIYFFYNIQMNCMAVMYNPFKPRFYMHPQKRYQMIGTKNSVIICIEVVNGQVQFIKALLNEGERQIKYGSVLAIQCLEKVYVGWFEN